ncbi:uracil/xanthine transporter [Pseudobacillus badius]|uniref:uracil/xanthine transporter n=1 Tax=Bacillus badius TaxID=1455 RepID=UPI0007B3D8B7|nr:uracil/xanthine transporter [Bacillus badius]KZR58140.1 uracil/xanthine transporter [Bacillus badius]MED0665342.1 uracil/xanthine transporter [Bacillus badius]
MRMVKALPTGMAAIQWVFFIFANTIVVPVSIGAAFDLSAQEVAMTLRSSLIFTGAACVLQGLWGHRYPLMEGHSGLMWGLLLNLSASASALGMDLQTIGGGVATGMMASAVFMIAAGLLGLSSVIKKVFTPMVMSVYLFLLSAQLIFIFFSGMLKITPEGTLDVPVSLLSVGIVLLVTILKVKGTGAISNFSILIGIVVGWILHNCFFPGDAALSASSQSFSLFPLGAPNLEWGIVLTTFTAGVLNISNTIASIQAAGRLYREEPSESRYSRSLTLTGFYTAAGSVLGLVPYAPFTSTIGFLESTRILERLPFLLGGALFSLLGLIPAVGSFFAAMPMTIGNAVLFVAYLQLFGTALQSIQGTIFNSNTIFRIALPVLTGISLMTTDPQIFSQLPVYVQPLFSNGLIMGVLLSMALELSIKWERYESPRRFER